MISISRVVRTAALVALAFQVVVPAFARVGASLCMRTETDVDGGVLPGVAVTDEPATLDVALRVSFAGRPQFEKL